MKRRTFGLLAGTSLAALKTGRARAQAATPDASQLQTTLTPFGGERAGNADGSIPAWTGGCNTLPAGLAPNTYIPDLFANEQPVVVVDASNMAQYAQFLTDGVQAMMTKYGFKIKVYPTHRTVCAPQWVYDNTAKNVATAQLDPAGGRWGFVNAYGGIPFPIPDLSDPLVAGAQIVWNFEMRWMGVGSAIEDEGYAVSDGLPTLSSSSLVTYQYPYYDPNGSYATWDGYSVKLLSVNDGPPNLVGQQICDWQSARALVSKNIAWEVFAGQGRVRKAPEIEFDTPASNTNGISSYDEDYVFNGSLEEYNWKYIEKKEMFVPYNNNYMFGLAPVPLHLQHFLDPEVVRWEKHRVWVVEATLYPGRRNIDARRRLYIDEDGWQAMLADVWDANNNLWKVNLGYNYNRPDVPGVFQCQNTLHDLQTGNWTSDSGPWNQKVKFNYWIYADKVTPDYEVGPQAMAANSQY